MQICKVLIYKPSFGPHVNRGLHLLKRRWGCDGEVGELDRLAGGKL